MAQTLTMLEEVFSSIRSAYAAAVEKTPDLFRGKNHFDLYPNEESEAFFCHVVESGERLVIHKKPFVYPDRRRGIACWDRAPEPVKGAAGQVGALVSSWREYPANSSAAEFTPVFHGPRTE